MPEFLQEPIAPGRPNRPGTPLKPAFITIHNTDNTNRGAGARAHSKFVRNTGYYIHKGKRNWVSWHFVVDDTHIVQQLPLNERAWHAGNGNARSIAIEICMNSDMDEAVAYENAALLTARLVRELGLGPDAIVTHKYWTNKDCPSVLLQDDRWPQFMTRVSELVSSLGFAPGVVELDPDDVQDALEAVDVEVDDSSHDIDHELLSDAVNEADVSEAPENE